MRKMVRKQRDGVRARKKRACPLLKNTKPTSRSGAVGEYYKRAYNVYSVPGSVVEQETHMESIKEVQQKLETQRLALTRLAAASWGFSLPRAREVYAKVIRSAIAYGATAFHKVTEPGGNAVGIAGSLRKEQTQCLRTVAGAYRATPVRALETETFVPPLDLYLNGRVAQFEGRIEESGMGQLIRDSCATIARKLWNRRRHYTMPQAHSNETTERVKRWLATDLINADRKKIQATLVKEWKERWQREADRSRARHRGRAEEPADEPEGDTSSADGR